MSMHPTGNPIMDIAENGNLVVRIPMALRRKQGRKMVLAPVALDGEQLAGHESSQVALVQALARAFMWAEMLESGSAKSITELARHLKTDPSYVARILRLANLAPDIVAAIVHGREPEGLSLRHLFQPFPDEWDDQRRAFGFAMEA